MKMSVFQRTLQLTSACCLVHINTYLENDSSQSTEKSSKRNARVVTVKGDAFERGEQMWDKMGGDSMQLARLRCQMYNTDGVQVWKDLSVNCESFWRKYAPVSWSELEGMSNRGSPSTLERHTRVSNLKLLGTDFEMQMSAWRNPCLYKEDSDISGSADDISVRERGKCTAFAFIKGNSAMCGQNVDEESTEWLEGSNDVVLKLMSNDESKVPDAMVYTHPGVPAYCGMNSKGLCVLNLYIDAPKNADTGSNLEYGLPIDVTIRELLTHHSIKEAIDWLENVPRMVPTTYMLLQGSTLVCMEVSPDRMVSTMSTVRRNAKERSTMISHSNHPLFDEILMSNKSEDKSSDAIGGTEESKDDSYSSLNRLLYVRRGIRRVFEEVDMDGFEVSRRVLEACPAAHPVYAPTLASVILDPVGMKMHIRFRNETEWTTEGF